MKKLTAYGKLIKHRLIDLDMSQKDLISGVVERTGLYFDGSYLTKIVHGDRSPIAITEAINAILGIQTEADGE